MKGTAKKKKALCYGLAVCDVLIPGVPREAFQKETTRIDRFTYSTGGDAINEAMTLVKLGHQARLMSLVGQDLFGDFILARGEEAGVDMDSVQRHPDLPTTVSLVCIHPDGERSFILNRGADNAISLDTVDWQALEEADLLAVGSAFSAPSLTAALPALLQAARDRGLPTCVDMLQGPGQVTPRDMESFLPYADYIFPNYEEGCFFTGEREPARIAARFQAWGASGVVLKVGREGCHLFERGGRHTYVPGFVPLTLKDTTGAGDNFAAGFMAGLLEGLPPEACATLANATAACSVGYVGATGLKGRAEVERMLACGSRWTPA